MPDGVLFWINCHICKWFHWDRCQLQFRKGHYIFKRAILFLAMIKLEQIRKGIHVVETHWTMLVNITPSCSYYWKAFSITWSSSSCMFGSQSSLERQEYLLTYIQYYVTGLIHVSMMTQIKMKPIKYCRSFITSTTHLLLDQWILRCEKMKGNLSHKCFGNGS